MEVRKNTRVQNSRVVTQQSASPKAGQPSTFSEPIDARFDPKNYSLSQNVVLTGKLLGITGALLSLLWLVDVWLNR